jgi:hypothetical protein
LTVIGDSFPNSLSFSLRDRRGTLPRPE